MTKYPYDGVDLREHPESHRVGRGEQGVFHAEPYKSEMLPLWRFKDEKSAKESSDAIFGKFIEYKEEEDFAGMDAARKFLQMGCMRAMRHAKREGGDKSRPREKLGPEKRNARRSSVKNGDPSPRMRSMFGKRKSIAGETNEVDWRSLRVRRTNGKRTEEKA